MKKILFPIIALILIACSAQVTPPLPLLGEGTGVRETPPPTQTPIPTPTLHPDFVALQKLIADSSNLVLLPDGTIENNGVVIPNLNVDQNGVINIIFNNENVVIETSQISFDDEGLTIDGYERNENGEWVEAQETVTIGGVTMTLDENGVVTELEATGANEEIKADNLASVDPTHWGYEVGEADIVKDETGIHIVVDGNNVARWVGTEWEWDGEMMEYIPLFDGFAQTYPTTDKGSVRVTNEVRADAAEILEFAQTGGRVVSGSQTLTPIYLYNGEDKSEAIVARSIINGYGSGVDSINTSYVVDGWVVFKTETGELVKMKFKDVEIFLRGFN